MNTQLEQYARQTLKEQLAKLPGEWQETFKLMYGRGKVSFGIPARTVEEACAMNINEVVDEIPNIKLDWAMQQVENSLKKLAKTS